MTLMTDIPPEPSMSLMTDQTPTRESGIHLSGCQQRGGGAHDTRHPRIPKPKTQNPKPKTQNPTTFSEFEVCTLNATLSAAGNYQGVTPFMLVQELLRQAR